MLTSWSGTRCPSAYTLSPAEPACTCQHKNRRQASCSPVQAYSAAVQSTSSQQPSGAELWEMGIADCEAESCGLIPNGALVLVRSKPKQSSRAHVSKISSHPLACRSLPTCGLLSGGRTASLN